MEGIRLCQADEIELYICSKRVGAKRKWLKGNPECQGVNKAPPISVIRKSFVTQPAKMNLWGCHQRRGLFQPSSNTLLLPYINIRLTRNQFFADSKICWN
ncbi:hypothetical protein J6590_002681 [Homalodisca vitripennis]|nr:hypothetical protein J6590_002681 [Homalodisca vitripennis]